MLVDVYECHRTLVGSFVDMRELFDTERVVDPTSVGVASCPLFIKLFDLFVQTEHTISPTFPLLQQLAWAKSYTFARTQRL